MYAAKALFIQTCTAIYYTTDYRTVGPSCEVDFRKFRLHRKCALLQPVQELVLPATADLILAIVKVLADALSLHPHVRNLWCVLSID